MHVVQALQSLEENRLALILCKPLLSALLVGYQLVNIALHVFEDEVEIIVDSDDFLQFYDVRMIKFPQSFDLSEGHALIPRVKFFLHLLYRYNFSILSIGRHGDTSVGAITQIFSNLVFIH